MWFPPDQPGVQLLVEIWREMKAFRAHLAVVSNAPELEAWHALITQMDASVFDAAPIDVASLQAGAH